MLVPSVATKWQHYLNYCKSKELTDLWSVSSFVLPFRMLLSKFLYEVIGNLLRDCFHPMTCGIKLRVLVPPFIVFLFCGFPGPKLCGLLRRHMAQCPSDSRPPCLAHQIHRRTAQRPWTNSICIWPAIFPRRFSFCAFFKYPAAKPCPNTPRIPLAGIHTCHGLLYTLNHG